MNPSQDIQMTPIKKRAAAALLLLAGLAGLCGPARAADDVDARATFFSNVFVGQCMQHINDTEALRANLIKLHLPKLPPQRAARFLAGKDGDAWPVTSPLGSFVLALPRAAKLCIVYAQKVDTAEVEKLFEGLVAKAPAPLVSEKLGDEHKEAAANVEMHRISYAWAPPDARNKLHFVLITSAKEDADVQAMASVSLDSD